MTKQSPSGYNTLQISLHWIVALLVLFQLFFGETMTNVVDATADGKPVSSTDQFIATAHYWVGISILALVVVRFTVRIFAGAPEPAGGSKLVALIAQAAHWAFYFLLAAVPVTGLLAIYVNDSFGDIHALGKPAFIVLITLHAAGAFFHQFFVKDGTLKRMLVPAR
jgi:cytochrome b561